MKAVRTSWRSWQPWRWGLSVVACLGVAGAVSAGEFGQSVVAGSNYDIDFNQEVDVGFSGFAGAWFLNARLIHNPNAGPMIKRFESPITDTLDPILLDALQPFPIPIKETFELYEPPILGPNDPIGAPIDPFDSVYGWYEEIFTDGWEWVTPGDPRYQSGPLFGTPLITRNGNPHPSKPAFYPLGSLGPDRPIIHRPDVVAVDFARIDAGETLGINKALLWVGTEGNRVWGDDQLDDGTPFNERAIRVWEHPTNVGAAFEMAGDFDGDGTVHQADLDLVLQNWGHDADAEGLPRGWFSNPADGVIDQGELDQVLQNWGAWTPLPLGPGLANALPEPGTVAGLALSTLALLRLRRGGVAAGDRG